MKTIKKAQSGVKQKPKPITGPTFVNLRMARDKSGTGLPATRQDSIDYKRGWLRGLKGDKPSAMEKKYQGENEYEKMGRWEGQNKGKKNAVKKAKNGTSLGMKSVKAGFDKNPGVTRADIIVAGKKEAKKGATIKKAQLGGLIKKGLNTAVKSTAKKKIPKISDDVMEKAMTKAGRADLKAKMKKWDSEMKTGGKVTKAKSGTSMKKCRYGCK